MKTKCIIVDDEPLAIEVIENHLQQFDDFEIIARCSDAIQAFEIIKQKKIDLIFLDIQMPKITGIDFLRTLNKTPKVIITTAYRDYALEGYELDVVDYLLKPIPFERFLKAINKYFQFQSNDLIVMNSSEPGPDNDTSFIYVRADKKIIKVLLKDITFIESIKDYVQIHTSSRKVITKNQISHFEEKLPPEKFVRIHRSYIVAISRINAFTSTTIEMGKEELPIGRSYKNGVIKALNINEKLY